MAGFNAKKKRLLGEPDPAATLLQLSLVGITSMTDRVATLDRIEHNLRHRLRYLDLRADDLVTRPSDDNLASLAVEGMLGAAAAEPYTKVRAGEGDAAIAKRAPERLFIEHTRDGTAGAWELQRIATNNFRDFCGPVTIDGQADYLNIVVVPNETGKSALLEAICAAFFVPHRLTNHARVPPPALTQQDDDNKELLAGRFAQREAIFGLEAIALS